MQVSPLHHLRRNAVAYLALFVALGGTSFAAATVITGKNVKNNSLTGADVKNSSLTGTDVKNKSLRPADFSGSVQGPQGPKGDTGPQGPKGDTGAKGDPGVVDAPQTPIPVTSFNNTWEAWGAGYAVSYWKDAVGIVHLTGGIRDGTVSVGTASVPIFTLPVGYRPTQIQYQPIVSTDSSDVPIGGAYLEICAPPTCASEDAGEVSVFGADNYYVSLDGISFRAN